MIPVIVVDPPSIVVMLGARIEMMVPSTKKKDSLVHLTLRMQIEKVEPSPNASNEAWSLNKVLNSEQSAVVGEESNSVWQVEAFVEVVVLKYSQDDLIHNFNSYVSKSSIFILTFPNLHVGLFLLHCDAH